METQKKPGKKILIIAGGCLLLLVIAAVVIGAVRFGAGKKYSRLLDLGQRYINELKYDDAIAIFDQAILIAPKRAGGYLGKARAEYCLGQFDKASQTLLLGLKKVDDPDERRLLDLLIDEFWDDISPYMDEDYEPGKTVTDVPKDENKTGDEEADNPSFLLDHTRIVRSVDTDDPEVQLRVLGYDDNKKVTWMSTSPEIATVSDDGLVTCQSSPGYCSIIATGEDGESDYCMVEIIEADSYPDKKELDSVRINMGDDEHPAYIIMTIERDKQKKTASLENTDRYVYLSGDVVIPDRLTYKDEQIEITHIPYSTFHWCVDLKTIEIPATVEDFSSYDFSKNPFEYCINLKEIRLNEANAAFKLVDGVLYSKDGTELIAYPAAKEGKSYTIPREVEIVWDGAFRGCKNLEEILVEDGNERYSSIDGVLINEWGALAYYPAGRSEAAYTVPDSISSLSGCPFYNSRLKCINFGKIEEIYVDNLLYCPELEKIVVGPNTKMLQMMTGLINENGVIKIEGLENARELDNLFLKYPKELNVFDYVDMNTLKRLTNLQYLTLGVMDNISDLSWLKDFSGLYRVNLEANEVTVSDLSSFVKNTNLDSLDIINYSSNPALMEETQAIDPESTGTWVSYYEVQSY